MMGRREVVYMAKSAEFGRIVADVIGRMGLRDAANKAGISAAYMGSMKDGTVPSEEILARFVSAFSVEGELARRLWESARAEKSQMDIEHILQFACDAAGFDTMERWQLLEKFRELAHSVGSQETTAA